MRKTNEQSLKEAIDHLLEFYKIKSKVTEVKVLSAWEEIMGKAIAKHTDELYIKNKKLYLRINSAVLKNELLMMKSKIIERVNEKAETNIVEEVVLL